MCPPTTSSPPAGHHRTTAVPLRTPPSRSYRGTGVYPLWYIYGEDKDEIFPGSTCYTQRGTHINDSNSWSLRHGRVSPPSWHIMDLWTYATRICGELVMQHNGIIMLETRAMHVSGEAWSLCALLTIGIVRCPWSCYGLWEVIRLSAVRKPSILFDLLYLILPQ